MFLKNLIFLQILNIVTCQGIKTETLVAKGNSKTVHNGAVYLNREHPLWILQDRKEGMQKHLFKPHEKFDTDKMQAAKVTPFHGMRNLKTKSQKRLNKKGVHLPPNYIPFQNARKSNALSATRRYKNSKFLQNMPVFDALPGEESFTDLTPIFVYTGKKGRMLLNTMLSKHKYPMQEPVPGQVLYPPPSLVFKPKPLIDNLKRKVNLTMIPFYAYEAIDPTSHTSVDLFQPTKSYKKAKQYTAFFSPEQVHSQPATAITQFQYTTFTTPVLDRPYANHRFENAPTPTLTTSTTPLPHKKLEVTYNDGDDKLQITYEDDNMALERPLNASPTTTQSPLPYESYTLDDNYYAFPVYTMSKLLEANTDDIQQLNSVGEERQRIEQIIDTALKEENVNSRNNISNEDTWFILNSRYKGPLKKNSASSIHSSKYVQTSAAKMFDAAAATTTTPTKTSP